jgi:protocatechuate 3,4-dioxygenase alpha subunit
MARHLRPTASQTVGPFFEVGLTDTPVNEIVSADTPGAIRIEGVVTDGQGAPVPDAMIEIWQAAPSARYPSPEDPRHSLPLEEGFSGFGRAGTDQSGTFWFRTVKPGPVPWLDGRPQAPHLDLSVFARGLGKRLVTRLYFPDEQEANVVDPVLSLVEDPDLRSTLIAVPSDGVLRFDIRLQGEGETCFFQI